MKYGFLRTGKRLTRALALGLSAVLLLSACATSTSSDEDAAADAAESADTTDTTDTVDTADTDSTADAADASDAADTEETSNSETEYKYGSIELPVLDGSLCWSAAILAVELGYFADEGFDATLTTSNVESNKIALNEGSIPIVLGDFQYFPSVESGVDVSVVAGLHQGCIKLVVLPDSDIETAEDLAGKTIGVDEIGGTPYMVTSLWIEQAGISADEADGEVTFLPYSDGNLQLEALYSGEIDVAAVWDPYGTSSSEAGDTRVILDIGTDEPFAGTYCCFVYASNKVLEEDPDQVAAALRALNKAQEYIVENTEDAVDKILATGYIAMEDEELAASLLESYNYCAGMDMDEDDDTLTLLENVEYFSQALYDIGYLTTDPETFVEQVYKEVDLGE